MCDRVVFRVGVGVPCPGTGGFWVNSDGIVTLQYSVPFPLIPGAQTFTLPTQAVFTATSLKSAKLVAVRLSWTCVPILVRTGSLSGPHDSLETHVNLYISTKTSITPYLFSCSLLRGCRGACDGSLPSCVS